MKPRFVKQNTYLVHFPENYNLLFFKKLECGFIGGKGHIKAVSSRRRELLTTRKSSLRTDPHWLFNDICKIEKQHPKVSF